jgi:hypothetical protein
MPANSRCIARDDGAREAFVQMDGFGELFLDDGILPRQLRVASERFVDATRIARAQRSGGVPGQQRLDFLGVHVRQLADSSHGQPRSTPAAFSSSANFFRA